MSIAEFRAVLERELGSSPDAPIEPGKMMRWGDGHKRGDRPNYARMFPDELGGVFGNFRTGLAMTWQAKQDRPSTPEERARRAHEIAEGRRRHAVEQARAHARAAERNARIWRECVRVTPGDPVARYLTRRGLGRLVERGELPQSLRLHPALEYHSDDGIIIGPLPCMVAPLLVLGSPRVLSLHRTYLTFDGEKAAVETVKKLTPAAGPLAGACVPLCPRNGPAMGIAEGIESALAARCLSDLPVQAAYSAGALESWQWPAGVRHVAIYADNDSSGTGQRAAERLAHRVRAAGLTCRVALPAKPGRDWADVWTDAANMDPEHGQKAEARPA